MVWFGVGVKDSWIPFIRNVYGKATTVASITVASIKIISIRVNVICKSFY